MHISDTRLDTLLTRRFWGHTWILSCSTVHPRRDHGSNRGGRSFGAGVPGMGDGGGVPAQPVLENLHCGWQCYHHFHHLWKPLDVVRNRLYGRAQLQGISFTAGSEWYVPEEKATTRENLTALLRSSRGWSINLTPWCQVTSKRLEHWWSSLSCWAPLDWWLPWLEYSVPKQEGKTMSLKGGLLALLESYLYFKVTKNTNKKSICWLIFGQSVKEF